MVNLQIHLGERFVHMLHVLASALHQLRTVADQNPYGADIGFWPEGPAQQSYRV